MSLSSLVIIYFVNLEGIQTTFGYKEAYILKRDVKYVYSKYYQIEQPA